MILYHTSNREIRDPDIHYGRKNADFGWGFYLTPDKDFTYRWASENAAKQLRFIRSEKIERMDGEELKAEQDAYQERFALKLKKILEEE